MSSDASLRGAAPEDVAPAADAPAGIEPGAVASAGIEPRTVAITPDTVATRPEAVVVDVLDNHGRVASRQRLVLSDGHRRFTIGRSVDADVMLDDPHVAPIHIEVALSPEGILTATDPGSINGIFVGGERHRHARSLSFSDGRMQLGRTQLRVHTAHQPLAAEKPDHALDDVASRAALRIAVAGGIACVVFIFYFAWVGATRDTAMLIVIGLAGGALIAAVWIAFWSLLSRIIRGEPRWIMHAAIVFGVTAVVLLIDWVFDIARFSFALPQSSFGSISMLVVAFALALYLHLTQVWTLRRRTGATLAAILPLLVFGTISWVQSRNEARDVNFIGVREKVFPPVFHLREGRTPDRFFDNADRLREDADNKRREIPADDNGGGSDSDED